MQPVEVTEKYVDATLEDCYDVDGKVDATDEECTASTTYGSPVQGQKTSQLADYGSERSAQDDGQNEIGDDDDNGGDNKDNYNEQDDSEDNN